MILVKKYLLKDQATVMPEFEDGLRIGNQSEARNSLQKRVPNIPEIIQWYQTTAVIVVEGFELA